MFPIVYMVQVVQNVVELFFYVAQVVLNVVETVVYMPEIVIAAGLLEGASYVSQKTLFLLLHVLAFSSLKW